MVQTKKIFKGPLLKSWQKDVVDIICNKRGSGLTCVVKSKRQCGKSFLCMGVLLHYALNYSNSINALVSPTLAQARKIYKALVKSSYPAIKHKNETLLSIEYINGSEIFFKSAEQRDNLRGYNVNGIVIIDEATYISDDILELVLPWRNVANAPMLIVSTPRTRSGFFFDYYQQGLLPDTGIVTVDWSCYNTSEMMSPSLLAQYRKVLTKNQYKSEIEGEFIDEDSMVFTNIKSSAIAEPFNGQNKYQGIYGGIDFGAGGGGDSDSTVLTLFDETGQQIFIDYFNDLGTFQTVERILSDLGPFMGNLKYINAENNSIGSPLIDLILKTANDKGNYKLSTVLHRWVTTNSSKNKLVSLLQVGLEQGKTKLLNDKVLMAQLSCFEATYNPKTQVVTYAGANNFHDDAVLATMMAWEAYQHSLTTGVYSIGKGSQTKQSYK